MIYDIKIYEWGKNSSRYSSRPRRINDGEYHIEWHRRGIEFRQCPEGNLHHHDGKIQAIHVKSGKLVPWDELIGTESSKELFEFIPIVDTPRYEIRVIKKTVLEWIKWNNNKEVPNNINTEVMWQIAQIEEWKWSPQMPLNEIRSTMIKLQNSLPKGIDDHVRDLILNTWKQRWVERAAQSMLSSETENQVSTAVNSFKIIMNDL